MKKIIPFYALIILVAFASCKKEDNKPKTKSDFLTSGTWSVTAVTSDDDGDGTYETNDFADFVACYKDNFYSFHADGIWELNEGPTKCEDIDPQTDTDHWQLTNNETNIILATDTYIIQELTNMSLVIKLVLDDNRSSLVTFTKR